jgi:hypothetical protein
MNIQVHVLVVVVAAVLLGVVASAAADICTSSTNVFTVVVDLYASELGELSVNHAVKLDNVSHVGLRLF